MGLMLAAAMSLPAAAQTCSVSISQSTPTSAFMLNGDGTVVHLDTGLMWKRCPEGNTWDGSACAGTAGAFTWQAALQTAAASNFAGYSDWRLPNIKELKSIVEERCANPSINALVFPNTPAVYFWSSSPFPTYPSFRIVSFTAGQDSQNLDFENYRVRLVRGGRPWFVDRPGIDVDGNGNVDPLTDGMLLLRYVFGLRGQALIDGVIGSNATRTTPADIESYLRILLP
jgi:hypothetical protein